MYFNIREKNVSRIKMSTLVYSTIIILHLVFHRRNYREKNYVPFILHKKNP